MPPRPENKRVWASLLKGKTAVIRGGGRRDGPPRSLAIKNSRGLDRRRASAPDSSRPKAEGHPDPGSDARSGETLESRLCLPCRGQPGSRTLGPGPHSANPVRRGRPSRQRDSSEHHQTRPVRAPNAKRCSAVADYLYRNRSRMRYDEYLANGWPIASGPVEGACKNLIKDRMERSGMRWTEQMAEAIVQLRAIYLSGDFDRYWQFHIEQDQRRLYPAAWSRRSKVATPKSFSNRDTRTSLSTVAASRPPALE